MSSNPSSARKLPMSRNSLYPVVVLPSCTVCDNHKLFSKTEKDEMKVLSTRSFARCFPPLLSVNTLTIVKTWKCFI